MAGARGRVRMTEGALLGVILRVALPITATNMAQALNQLANAFFVGRISADAIAAVAASGPLYMIFIALGSGLSTAGAVLVAQNIGAGREEMANHVAAQTLLMIGVVGTCFAAIGFAISPFTLAAIGVEPTVQGLTMDYLSVSYLGLVSMYGAQCCQAMLQSVGEVRFAMKVMMGSVALNIALNPLLIFGIGSWDGLGVAGAATATVVAQTCALAVLLGHMLTGHSQLLLHLRDFRPDAKHFGLALGIGIPASLDQSARSLGGLVLMTTAASFGTVALASYGMGTRVMSFWFMPMIGLSIALTAVVGQNIGAGQMDRAVQAGRTGALVALCALTVIGLLMLPLVRPVMEVLAPGEDEVITRASHFGYIAMPFLGIFALPSIFSGVFRGAGSTKQAMVISMIMQYGIQIPFAWIASRYTSLGILAVYWSFPVANLGAALLGYFWFRTGRWKRDLVHEPAVADAPVEP